MDPFPRSSSENQPPGPTTQSEGRAQVPRLPTRVRVLAAIGALAALTIVVGFGLMRILGPADRFTTFVLPYTEDFQSVDTKRWFAESGVWSIRDETLAQITNLDDGAQIFIPKKVADGQFYHLSTYISLSSKTRSAGINFNAQYPKLSQHMHQLYLTRTVPEEGTDTQPTDQEVEALTLIAGYTDDTGLFVPQVSVPIAEDSEDYRLDLYVTDSTYAVQLNGQTVIEKRPLFYPNGVIGFHSLGPVKFDSLKITVAEDAQPGELVYTSDFEQDSGGAGWVPFAGNWELSGGKLVQTDADQLEAGIGYEGSAFENYVLQAEFHHLEGTGGGLLFNLPSPYQVNGGHMVRFSDQTDSVFWGYYNASGVFERQGYADIPEIGAADQKLRVYSDDSLGSYDIYLDEDLLARGIPLQRSTGHIGLITSFSSVAYATVEVFPLFAGKSTSLPTLTASDPNEVAVQPAPASDSLARETNATDPPLTTSVEAGNASTRATTPSTVATPTLPVILAGNSASITDRFTGDILASSWKPISKSWQFENGTLVQTDAEQTDQAIVYSTNAFRNYSYEVQLTHLEGTGAGLLFNMPFADRLNGAHLVRYSDRTLGGAFWGYFDDKGVFVGQGHATVDIPFNQTHRLRVVSGDTSYSVYLDNVLLVSNVPLRQNVGHVGLLTSKSAAAFDAPRIGGVQETATLSSGRRQGSTERTVVSGEWVVENGVFQQMAPDATDMLLNSGIYAAHYVAEAEITLPDRPEAGGGFVVHMREPNDTAGAFIVRLIRGGEGIFWGTYDEAGQFRGRGSEELTKNPAGVYRVKVAVEDDRIDIFVDDEQIATDVLMPYSEGWIGLVAHTGPVTFQDVAIDVEFGAKATEQGATE
jgi:hypothetical protein